MGNRIKVFLSFISIFMGATAMGSATRLELPLKKIYVPEKGFDDNDHIEVVVEGELPSACYSVDDTVVEPNGTGKLIVHQFAKKIVNQNCRSGDMVDDPVEFTAVGKVGSLVAGDYVIQFRYKDEIRGQGFHVDEAVSSAIDNSAYANVRNLDAQRIILEGEEAVLTLEGTYSSSCQKLKLPLEVKQQRDLFIVTPILEDTGSQCEKISTPFRESVSLGKLRRGTYLVHARSRAGKAVYKSFEVWPDAIARQ